MNAALSCILGTAAGLHYGDVRPFAASLERTGFQGRCILFVTPTTRGIDRIRAHGIRTLLFERPPELAYLSYNAYRYFLYQKFMESSDRRFERVLLTDVRDVVFQRDPFSFPWTPGLNITLEDRRMTIDRCPHMVRWLEGHPGGATWEKLRNRPISCSGITAGDHDAMLRYLEALTERLLPFTPGKRMAGYDQAVHNRLLHAGQLDPVQMHDNTGPILTLGYKQELAMVNASGDILNDAGEPAVIVHQYDRMKPLFDHVRQRFMA
ncbi:MAG: hypothetical protein ACLFQR_11070 [Desulfovibrionales bacterium]